MTLKGSISDDSLTGSIGRDKLETINIIPIKTVLAGAYPPPTGITTEYAEGDDAWQYYNVWKPLFESMKGYRVITPVLFDFFTLVNKNAFGGYSRFTDENGGQDYNNDYVIDHFTGLGWITNKQPNNGWFQNLIDTTDKNIVGFDDYYMPNYFIMASITQYELYRHINYTPFNFDSAPFGYYTSTTSVNSNSNIFAYDDNSGRFFTDDKDEAISARTYLIYRIHYQPQ